MKKIVYLLIIIISIVLIYFPFAIKEKHINVDGNLISIFVNGSPETSIPSGPKTVSLSCNASVKGFWNAALWQLELTNMSNQAACKLEFNDLNDNDYLNNKIIELYQEENQNEIEYTNKHEYRYVGYDPNNYIWFNNELWRIIGVFDSNSTGVNQNLTKIIRVDSLGGIGYDAYYYEQYNADLGFTERGVLGKNNWSTSTLKTLLNTYYYNSRNGSSYCHDGNYMDLGICDYSNQNGIKDEYRNMIQQVTWYLGGLSSASNNSSSYFYSSERKSSSIPSGGTATTTGYIGLMYVSDYGYAAGHDCYTYRNVVNYGSAPAYCAGKDWLFTEQFMTTITPCTKDNSSVFQIETGALDTMYSTYSYDVTPVLYLKSNVYVASGDGTQSNPFVIGIDTR